MKKTTNFYKNRQILICLFLALISGLLQSCATLSNNLSTQTIAVTTNVTSFSIYYNKKFIKHVESNTTTIILKKPIKEHRLSIQKEGYETAFFDLKIKIKPKYYYNTLFLPLSLTSSSLDSMNHNVYEYAEKKYYIDIQKISTESIKYQNKIKKSKKMYQLILLTYDKLIIELYYQKGVYYEAFIELLDKKYKNKEYISKALNKKKLKNCTDPVKLLYYLKKEFEI